MDLLNFCLNNPNNSLARLALADYLEELDDPRSELVRLIPTLLSLPQRVGLRPDVPIEMPDPVPTHQVWDWSGYFRETPYQDVRGLWPELRSPKPYRKFPAHNLGRLFLCALIREMVLPIIPDILYHLNRYELFNCKLIDHKIRDAGSSITSPGELNYNNASGINTFDAWQAIWHCRKSRFGCYIAALPYVIDYPINKALAHRCCGNRWEDDFHFYAKAEFYGRVLDLHEKFVEICPWEAAKEITRKAKIVRRIEWEARNESNF